MRIVGSLLYDSCMRVHGATSKSYKKKDCKTTYCEYRRKVRRRTDVHACDAVSGRVICALMCTVENYAGGPPSTPAFLSVGTSTPSYHKVADTREDQRPRPHVLSGRIRRASGTPIVLARQRQGSCLMEDHRPRHQVPHISIYNRQ